MKKLNEPQKKTYSRYAKSVKIIAVFGAILLGVAIAVWEFFSSDNDRIFSKTIFSMDTAVSFKIKGNENALLECSDLVKELDGLFDRYDPESDISRLNKLKSCRVSPYTAEILTLAKQLHEKYPQGDITCGDLSDLWNLNGEPRTPKDEDIKKALSDIGSEGVTVNGDMATLENGSVDLGCCAKGYACDKVYEILNERSVKEASVSFGSSAVVMGENIRVEIKDPFESSGTIGEVRAITPFVSTSGGYERGFEADGVYYTHIFDLQTGYPVLTDLASVTVFAQSGIKSDFLSTCIYIDGSENINHWLEMKDIWVVAVTTDKKIYLSQALKDSFKLYDNELEIID